MKKIVRGVLCLLIVIAIFPMNMLCITANASTTKTLSEAILWLNAKVGNKVGSGECVALIKAYYEFLGAPTPYGNGCDYATNPLPSGWQRIKGATPQAGDILVWTEGLEGYGHVAIYGGNNNYYHQNWSGRYVQILNKSYTNGFSISSGQYYAKYWGVIRPDYKSTGIENAFKDITPGNYFIRNKENGEYLNIANAVDEDKASIHLHRYGNYDSQTYNIRKMDDGYEMMPLSSSTRVVNPYCDTVVSGKTVNLYGKTNESSQWWKFQPVGDGFVIRNAQNPNVCLTPYNYGIIVSEYTGSDEQIWYLEKACTIKFDANGGSNAPASIRVRAGYSESIPSGTPTKTCNAFNGWTKTKGSASVNYKAGASINVNNDTTLYAVWSVKHSYGSWSQSKAPSCTTAGQEKRICSGCKATETKNVDALGHNFTSPSITKKPTCTETGIESGKCTRCNKETTNTLPLLGHKFSEPIITKKPTCTESGREEGLCELCGKSVGQDISPIGHDFGEGVVAKPSTEDETGVMNYTCEVCGEIKEEEIPCAVKQNNSSASSNSEDSKSDHKLEETAADEEETFSLVPVIIAIAVLIAGLATTLIIVKKKSKNEVY